MTVRIYETEIAQAIREYLQRRGIAVTDETKFTILQVAGRGYVAETRDFEQPMKEGPYR